MAKKNIYTHEIELQKLTIKNDERHKFASEIEKIKYRGYEVENISDGRKIVITKPGGKFTFGTIKKEDFMVFIFNPTSKTLWLISHQNILDDLIEKGKANTKETLNIISALEEVFNGSEPDVVLKKKKLNNPVGENPEALLKAYKWIWGQEDVNYPTGKGRSMSFEGILELRKSLKSSIKGKNN